MEGKYRPDYSHRRGTPGGEYGRSWGDTQCAGDLEIDRACVTYTRRMPPDVPLDGPQDVCRGMGDVLGRACCRKVNRLGLILSLKDDGV